MTVAAALTTVCLHRERDLLAAVSECSPLVAGALTSVRDLDLIAPDRVAHRLDTLRALPADHHLFSDLDPLGYERHLRGLHHLDGELGQRLSGCLIGDGLA